jgi:hypothetical protein
MTRHSPRRGREEWTGPVGGAKVSDLPERVEQAGMVPRTGNRRRGPRFSTEFTI